MNNTMPEPLSTSNMMDNLTWNSWKAEVRFGTKIDVLLTP